MMDNNKIVIYAYIDCGFKKKCRTAASCPMTFSFHALKVRGDLSLLVKSRESNEIILNSIFAM